MATDRRTARLTKRSVDAAGPEPKAYRLWDTDLRGFGLKVSPRGVKTYFVWYRAGEGRRAPLREYTVARHGVMTPDEARTGAAKVLGRVRLGQDPQAQRKRARDDISVEALCDLYLAEGVATKKVATITTDKSRIRTHINPLLGRRPAAQVTQQEVARFVRDVAAGKSAAKRLPTVAQVRQARMELRAAKRAGRSELTAETVELLRSHSIGVPGEKGDRASELTAALVRLREVKTRGRNDSAGEGGKGAATRTLGLLGAIFSFAVREGVRTDNPVTGVQRFKDNQAQRFLSPPELARLAKALAHLEGLGTNRAGLTVIRLLAFTGARKSEIEGLRWDEVDLGRRMLRLADSKTGARVVLLAPAALECLSKVERSPASPFVFPGGEASRHYVGTPRIWERVKETADLPGVRLHDLRHTFASYGAGGGLSLQLIGALLGHRDVKTTSQYAHLADDPLRAASERTGAAIAGAMAGKAAPVTPFPDRRGTAA